MNNRVLIISNNNNASPFNHFGFLENQDLMPVEVHDEARSLYKLEEVSPIVVIINIQMMKRCWEIIYQIREESDVPILLLCKSSQRLPWEKALEYGIDICLAINVRPAILVARIKAVIRRYQKNHSNGSRDTKTHKPTVGEIINLVKELKQ